MIEIAGQSRRGRGRSKDAVLHPQNQASVAEITDNGRRLQGEERLTSYTHLPIHPVKSRVARPCTELSALLAGVGHQIESKAARSTKIDVFAGRTHLGPDGSRRGLILQIFGGACGRDSMRKGTKVRRLAQRPQRKPRARSHSVRPAGGPRPATLGPPPLFFRHSVGQNKARYR